MKFGLTKSQYEFILENIATPLREKGAEVYAFGSRARGTQEKFSDLDLMIETDADLRSEIGKLSEILENSNFPFKVDLVLKSDFAGAYLPAYNQERQIF